MISKHPLLPTTLGYIVYRFAAINPSVEGEGSQAVDFVIGDHRLVVGVERGWNLEKGRLGDGEEEGMVV